MKNYRQDLDEALNELARHEEEHGAEPADAGQAERRSRLVRQVEKAGDAFEAHKAERAEREAKLERVREAAKDPRNVEPAFYAPGGEIRGADRWNVGTASRSQDPWQDGLDMRTVSADDLRSRAETALERSEIANGDMYAEAIDADPTAAQFVVTRSNPAYRSAFEKIVANPERAHLTFTDAEARAVSEVEAARASLSTSTGTGGYLIPLSLDPAAIIANNGAANPFRQIARTVMAPVSPHRVVTSAGSNAEWLAENTAAADGTPTFGKLDISLFKQFQWITASYEVSADGALLAQNIAEVAADARARLEASAFAIGSGSGAPYGVVTRVAAVTASRVSPTTGGVFTTASVNDVYRTYDALPARARQSANLAWVANNSVFSIVRQMSPSTNGSSFWTNIGEAMPGALLGAGRYEASAMDSTMTTGANVVVVGDFSRYVIVDHAAGPSMEFVQNVVDGSGIPTGTRGWIYWHRVGADCTDASQFRLLQL